LNSERNETINKVKNKYKESLGALHAKIEASDNLIERLNSEKEEQKIKWEESLNQVDEKMRECEEKAGKLEEEKKKQIVITLNKGTIMIISI
jgi:hypothetical protein